MKDEAVKCEVNMGRFQISVTATVIGQIPSAGSAEKLLNDHGLNGARTY